MKGSDKIEMKINIGGESIKLKVGFDEQNSVRDTEREIKLYFDRLKKAWPENSEKNILAMTAFQFANWYHQLLRIQEDTLEAVNNKIQIIDEALADSLKPEAES